jgi:hypothetical protein
MFRPSSILPLLNSNKYVTTKFLFCKHSSRLVSKFYSTCPLSPVKCLSSFTSDPSFYYYIMSSYVLYPSFSAILLTLCFLFLLAVSDTLHSEQVCLFISEIIYNPSKQTIFPNGYNLYSPYGPYGLYRASVDVQGCTFTLPLPLL